MNASTAASLLAQRAEAVCRRYLPHGRKQGRYWCAGDVHGAQGRSLFVRLAPPGTPGKWTDAATSQHGDLLDLIRLATGARSLREALAEARRFLALPTPPTSSGPDAYDRTEAALNLWRRCRPIADTHGEAYLQARAIGSCRFPSLRFHASLAYRHDSGRWARYPALVAAVTGDDAELHGVHRTWLDPDRPLKAPVARPRKALGRIHGRAVRFDRPEPGSELLVGEGIETVLSLLTALPGTLAAAALSAGSLGAFEPPPGLSRLLIALDRDPDGQRAADRLKRRCARLGIDTVVLVPERNDFNDDLRHRGPRSLAGRLVPRLRHNTPEAGGHRERPSRADVKTLPRGVRSVREVP